MPPASSRSPRWRRLLHFALLLALGLPLPLRAETLLIDDFEQGLASCWGAKSFKGTTLYEVIPADGGRVLHAQSHGTASGLVCRQEYTLQEWPILAWRWKIAATVPGGDARSKAGDDYAARVYVVFPHWFFPKTRSLNYIWANRLPRGEAVPNPFTANTIMLAVESGAQRAGTWIEERRNVLEDYHRLFGEEPPPVGAIAIMTDTDNTGASAEAWYDDLRRERP